MGELEDYIAAVTPAVRRRDADTLLPLFARVTGLAPELLRGSIVGYGSYHYHYASGRQGDAPAAAFAPRKAAMTVYLMDGVGAHADLLARLGPHTTGVGCVYLKDLSRNDLAVLEQVVRASFATLTSGTYGYRARETGQ